MVGLNVSYLLVLAFCASGVLSAPLCLSGDFDSQLQHILRTQVLPTQDPAPIISRVLHDVRATLSQRWQGFKLFPFGSIIMGVDTTASDLDISLHIPNFNFSSALYVIEETKQLFQKQPDLYTDLDGVHMPKFTRFSFKHIPTRRKVDLVFHLFMYGEEAIATSKLLRYYFNLDERNLTLARILKYLFKIHGLTGRETETLMSYTVYLLLIFYLQQENMAPPIYALQKDSESVYWKNWDVSFNELPYSTTNNTQNLYQLLGGFFKYYSEFNFDENIVSPYIGRAIPRSVLIDVDNNPQEHFFNNYFNRTIQLKIRNDLKCRDLCIQAPFHLSVNKGERITLEYATKFKTFMKSGARMFEDLPSGRILHHKETVINHSYATVPGINEENCIDATDT